MSCFREWSIKCRLTLLTMGTTTLALVLAAIVLVSYNQYVMRDATIQNLNMIANIVGANSATALSSNDPKAATMTMRELKTELHVISACLFLPNGARLAAYTQPGVESATLPSLPLPEGHYWRQDQLELFKPIRLDGKLLGTLNICLHTQIARSTLINFLKIIALVVTLSSLCALLLTPPIPGSTEASAIHL